MAAFDLIVRGDEFDVAVSDGVVAAVGPELAGGGREELDARGLRIMAGTVDAHVHLNDPGRTHWEGIASGSRALAAGGTTTAVDMPLNSVPATVDGAAFDAKAAIVDREAHVDLALWGGLVPGGVAALDELAARGVVGFKAFMSASGVDEFPRVDDATLGEGMRRAAALGLPVAVHAEDEATVGAVAAAAPDRTLRCFMASRPIKAELDAVARVLALAADTGCAVHLVHLSSAAAVAAVAAARAAGTDATAEACAHHLVLDEEDAVAIGVLAKCAPPLRRAAELDGLWEAVTTGDVHVLASDHSPSPPDLRDPDDAFASWGGIGAGQLLSALVLDAADRRHVPVATVAAALSVSPARRLALPGKDGLRPGADADLLLVAPDAPWTVRACELLHRHPQTAFEGRTLRPRIRRVLLRGATIAVDGRPTGPPRGRLLRRTAQGRCGPA